MIYLDNNATTKPAPAVLEAINFAHSEAWANPSSNHNIGQSVSRHVGKAREKVAEFIGVKAERVTFTSGATEGNEAVLRHFANLGATLITSNAEHLAVTGYYENYHPNQIRYVPIDHLGLWDLTCLIEFLRNINGLKLVAFSWANGETGVLQDRFAIQSVVEEYDGICLVDISQAVGRVLFKADSTSFYTFSGHKIHGPKGIGVLVQPQKSNAVRVAIGGGQENGIRGGTLNVPGILGLGVACEIRHYKLRTVIDYMARLRDMLESKVENLITDIKINGKETQRIPNTCNITLEGVDGMALIARLEKRGIYCSQVSACSSARPEPSRTLMAMGLSEEEAYASIRFAVAEDTSEVEVSIAADVLMKETLFLRKIMGNIT